MSTYSLKAILIPFRKASCSTMCDSEMSHPIPLLPSWSLSGDGGRSGGGGAPARRRSPPGIGRRNEAERWVLIYTTENWSLSTLSLSSYKELSGTSWKVTITSLNLHKFLTNLSQFLIKYYAFGLKISTKYYSISWFSRKFNCSSTLKTPNVYASLMPWCTVQKSDAWLLGRLHDCLPSSLPGFSMRHTHSFLALKLQQDRSIGLGIPPAEFGFSWIQTLRCS